MNESVLIDVREVGRHLYDPTWRLVDCRASLADPEAGRRAYETGHIPGAVHAHLDRQLAGPIVPGTTGRHPLPDRIRLEAAFRAWGIDAGTRIVAYDADNGAFAARLWWLARWLGHAAVAVLDGGYAAWVAAAGAIETGVSRVPVGSFKAGAPLTHEVTTAELARAPESWTIVDARGAARYRGDVEPIDPVAGHIPGALNLPFEDNLRPDGRFCDATELAMRYRDVTNRGRPVVFYCGSGVTACHDLLAFTHAGLGEAFLYPGSWSEWIQDPRRPVERGAAP